MLPPLMDAIQISHWGKEIVSVGGELKRGWMGGCYIVRRGNMTLLKTSIKGWCIAERSFLEPVG